MKHNLRSNYEAQYLRLAKECKVEVHDIKSLSDFGLLKRMNVFLRKGQRLWIQIRHRNSYSLIAK